MMKLLIVDDQPSVSEGLKRGSYGRNCRSTKYLQPIMPWRRGRS